MECGNVDKILAFNRRSRNTSTRVCKCNARAGLNIFVRVCIIKSGALMANNKGSR